jgi:copper homeostasis protein (lipoprotein)
MFGRACAAALCLVASAPFAAGAQTAHVTGTITYRERMTLSPTAVVDLRLDDVTRPGAIDPVIASTRLDHLGQVPIRFDLPYDPHAIDQRNRYAVRAVISDNGMVLFASLDTALVLTQNKGPRVDLVLTRIGTGTPPPPQTKPAAEPPVPPLPPMPFPDLPATFAGTLPCADCEGIRYQLNLFADDSFFLRMTYLGRKVAPLDDIGSWALSSDRRVLALKARADRPEFFAITAPGVLRKLDVDGQPIPGRQPWELKRAASLQSIDVRLPVRGMYVKAGNAGAFVECSTGQLWQVTGQSPALAELDRAYAAARPVPGTAVLADVEGVVAPRPAAEGGGLRDSLTIEKFVRVARGQSCPARFASAPLAGTFWKLTNLNGREISAVADPRRQPSLTFQAPMGRTPGQYSGSTGCNRLIGTFVTANATIAMTGGGTLIACKEETATEATFLGALKATRTFRITGHRLELFDDTGKRVATFEGT